jgi:hypothetical protein
MIREYDDDYEEEKRTQKLFFGFMAVVVVIVLLIVGWGVSVEIHRSAARAVCEENPRLWHDCADRDSCIKICSRGDVTS